jgi:hypothetical protein
MATIVEPGWWAHSTKYGIPPVPRWYRVVSVTRHFAAPATILADDDGSVGAEVDVLECDYHQVHWVRPEPGGGPPQRCPHCDLALNAGRAALGVP